MAFCGNTLSWELWFCENSRPERSFPSESPCPDPRREGILDTLKHFDDGCERIQGAVSGDRRINEWHEAPGAPFSTLGPSLSSGHSFGELGLLSL